MKKLSLRNKKVLNQKADIQFNKNKIKVIVKNNKPTQQHIVKKRFAVQYTN